MDSNPRTRDSENLHSTVRKQPSTALSHRDRLFLAGELIGESVLVEWSSCKEFVGLRGRVVDETLGSFVIEEPRGENKRLPKKACTFFFPAAGVRVEGKKLLARPEERTKKMLQAK